MRLIPVSGHGRLVRTEHFTVYTASPDPDLLATLTEAADTFKAAAEYIVKRGFDVTDLVILNVETCSAMLFGDVQLRTSQGRVLTASDISTWVEVSLAEDDVVLFDGADPTDCLDADFQLGCISAGGFATTRTSARETARLIGSLLADQPLNDPSSDGSAETSAGPGRSVPFEPLIEPPSSTHDVHTGLHLVRQTEDTSLFDPLADPTDFDLERLGSERNAPGRDRGPAPIRTADVPDRSRQTSSEQPMSVPEAEPGPPSTPPAAPSNVPEVSAPPTLADPAPAQFEEPPVGPPPPIGGGQVPAPNAREWSKDVGPPPSVALFAGERTLLLRFDDGQAIEVANGLYVGRHPTKTGLPSGFDAVTIRSEQVSRRHWQVVVVEGRAEVSDLGSKTGTSLERPNRAPEAIEVATPVEPGDKIWFADRWAAVERTE